jgi:flagellar hook-associated protein 2
MVDASGTVLQTGDFGTTLEHFASVNGKTLMDGESTLEFTINGKDFSFDKTETLTNVINTINADATANVNVSFDNATGKFSITSKTAGAGGKVEITNGLGNAFGADSILGIADGTYASAFKDGQNAKATINGIAVERASNSFSIDGINYTLNKVTSDELTVTVSKDATAVVDKVKTFVTGYNTLVKKLEEMLAEKKTTDEAKYTPLTDEEKASLSEEQIAQWEAIAKKGLLRNDSGIKSMLTSLRNALYETVTGAGLAPSSIGVKTGSYFSSTGGQIVLDEDVLRADIEKDPERVMQVFANTSSDADTGTKYKANGLLTRMSNIMDQYLNSYQINALDGISSSLTKINTKITDMETKMSAKQEQLYLKFAAMETAMSALNSQSDWLTSIMSSQSSK